MHHNPVDPLRGQLVVDNNDTKMKILNFKKTAINPVYDRD